MIGVSTVLKQTVIELQKLESIREFALGGGTNLALRYNHRLSIDIDFITSNIIGKSGFEKIIKEVQDYFGENKVKIVLLNSEFDEQYLFLKTFISKENEIIKVEFLQNMKCLFEQEL